MHISGSIFATFDNNKTAEEFFEWCSFESLCCWTVSIEYKGLNCNIRYNHVYHQSPNFQLNEILEKLIIIFKKIIELNGTTKITNFLYDIGQSYGSIHINRQQQTIKSIGFNVDGHVEKIKLKW